MDHVSDRAPNDHLQSEELAALYDRVRGGHGLPQEQDLHPHLGVCLTCRQRFHNYLVQSERLLLLRAGGPVLRQHDCPSGTVWREIAAAQLAPETELALIQHASRCDHCGILLHEAIGDLNGEITAPEQSIIASLNSAQAWWQSRLAQRIAGDSSASAPGWALGIGVPRLAMAGTALTVLLAVGVGLWIATRPTPAAKAASLLASAYTEQRTLQLRIAGARYAAPNVERGPEGSLIGRPSALLKAEALIAEQLRNHPADPIWLQAKARADLLDGKYDAALESLKHARQIKPKSPDILTDLGTVYFQQRDYGAAYETLSQALALKPDDPLVLFNRAAVAEQLYLYQQASDDWQRCLQLDAGSDWAGEAREGLERVRARLKAHEGQSRLMTPQQLIASVNDPNLRSRVDGRVEEYLQEAVRNWLPAAFPAPVSAQRTRSGVGRERDPEREHDRLEASAAPRALFFLADLTREQHNDHWLSDLLRGSSTPSFPQAVAALALAVHANDTGDYNVTRVQSARAARWFRADGNAAGVLRAQFEQTYAEQIESHGEACRQRASSTLAESEAFSYSWLQIQLGLEKGLCSGLMGDFDTEEKADRRAVAQAQESGYGALYLRALIFSADSRFATGAFSDAWKLSLTGLQRYWSGQFPSMRGYSFYTQLAYMANTAGNTNLEVASWRAAVGLVDSDPDLLLRAVAHTSWGNAATAAHQPQIARQQYAEAARLYSLAPRNDASRSAALELEISTAQLEARQGELDLAFARLTRVQNQVRLLSNNYSEQRFYSTLGELQLRRQRYSEAEQALRPALELTERSLASLASEAERTAWSKDASLVYLAMTEAKLAQGLEQESLEMYEWYLGASQRVALVRRPPTSPAAPPFEEPARISSRWPQLSRETVLAFAPLPDGLAIWVCDDRGVKGKWISSPSRDLQENAARFYDLVSDPKSDLDALRRDGANLYQSLIAPVQPWLAPERTLVIEADGWLARVPFEALVDSDRHYLIERWPVVHSLGQESEARLRGDLPISVVLPALIVASTASSQKEGLLPLINVAAEADAVARDFRSAQVLKGNEVTLRTVGENLPGTAVFHFAGHALTAPDHSGLLLEGGGVRGGGEMEAPALLSAAAVRQLNTRSLQLAVLSACSTGSDAEGFSSVTEALLRAGVPHVVASRWAVVETRGFVNSFYRSALSGHLVSEAIREASRTMLADRRTAHPYYWSAFSAYGRP